MFFKCDCGSEAICVEQDLELFDDDKRCSNLIYFSIYHCGTEDHKPSIQEKLRHCWKILKTGKNYADQIILNEGDARTLGEHLIELTYVAEKKGMNHEKNNNR